MPGEAQVRCVSFTIALQVVSICPAPLKQPGYWLIKKFLKAVSGIVTYCALQQETIIKMLIAVKIKVFLINAVTI